MLKRSLLVVSMAAVVLAGCRNKEAAEDAAPAAESTAVPAPAEPVLPEPVDRSLAGIARTSVS